MASSTTVPVKSRSPNHKHNLSFRKWNSSRPRNFRSPTNITTTTTAATNECVAFDDDLVTESSRSRSRSRSRSPLVRQSSIFCDYFCEGYLSPPPPPQSSPLLLPNRPDVDDNEVAPAKCHSPGRGCFGNRKNPIECRGKLRIPVPSINRGVLNVIPEEEEEEKQEELEDQSNKTKSSAILVKLASNEKKKIGQEDGKRNNASDLDEKKPEQRTWNLRPRKTKPLMDYNGREFTSSIVVKDKGIQSTEMNVNNSNPIISETGKKKGLKISLSKKEIEEDFLAFTGSKPRRNPKKRSKTSQYLINYQLPCSRRMKPCIIADN